MHVCVYVLLAAVQLAGPKNLTTRRPNGLSYPGMGYEYTTLTRDFLTTSPVFVVSMEQAGCWAMCRRSCVRSMSVRTYLYPRAVLVSSLVSSSNVGATMCMPGVHTYMIGI